MTSKEDAIKQAVRVLYPNVPEEVFNVSSIKEFLRETHSRYKSVRDAVRENVLIDSYSSINSITYVLATIKILQVSLRLMSFQKPSSSVVVEGAMGHKQETFVFWI